MVYGDKAESQALSTYILVRAKLLAGLLTIAFAGILVEATFRMLERGTVVRWGMKVGRE